MLRKLQIALLVPLALAVTGLLFLNRSGSSPIPLAVDFSEHHQMGSRQTESRIFFP